MRPHIHITGGPGAGVTTLAAALASRLQVDHLDIDDFYWRRSGLPFSSKIPMSPRLRAIRSAMRRAHRGWVLSGSIESWGQSLTPCFELVVYLDTPKSVRLERIRAREVRLFGRDRIDPGGVRHLQFMNFLTWAARYEEGGRPGRTRRRHAQWLRRLRCPVIRLDGTRAPEELVAKLLNASVFRSGP